MPNDEGLKDILCHRLAAKESQKCTSCTYCMVTTSECRAKCQIPCSTTITDAGVLCTLLSERIAHLDLEQKVLPSPVRPDHRIYRLACQKCQIFKSTYQCLETLIYLVLWALFNNYGIYPTKT